jgi:hypothetical protein
MAVRGTSITLTSYAYQYVGGPLVDPSSVTLEIFDSTETSVAGPFTYSADLIRISTGRYSYTWTIPDDEALGTHTAKWTIVIDGATSVGYEDFEVTEVPETPDTTLLEDQTLIFAASITPLYIDPEELISLFPDSNLTEIAEYIYIFSSEVKTMLKLDDGEEPSFLALEYIKAATACALSKIYGDDSNDELSFRLGDLSVQNNGFTKNRVTRANATTWCELAAVLRNELISSTTGMKVVVKGANYKNPIPVRAFKRY